MASSTSTLHLWLEEREGKGEGDRVILAKDFVIDPHTTGTKPFSSFVSDDGKTNFDPTSLVFTEADSEPIDKETGKKISAWSYA